MLNDLIVVEPDYSFNSQYVSVLKMDQIGGIKYKVGLTKEATELLDFLKMMKTQIEQEALQRQKHPLVKDLWDQYQTALALTK